jgi:catechol 2,3-dioxygenase-like lactoylglutathione lyase family enzyme
MPGSDLATSSIGQIAVVVHDVERALTFYRDHLGLPFLFQFPGLAFVRAGEVRLMLSKPEGKEHDHPGSILYFKVAGIETVCATLRERGVRFKDEPHLVHRAPTHELWMAFFDDTEGNLLAVMEEKAVAA